MQIGNSTSNPYLQSDLPATRAVSSSSCEADPSVSSVTSVSDDNADVDNGDIGVVSPMKELAAGALGLDSPDAPDTDTNTFYTAGKVIAAAVTIGKIISLFV
jgi:hypothetical protein